MGGLSQIRPSVVEGFPFAGFDFAVVVPAEQAAVVLIGAAAVPRGWWWWIWQRHIARLRPEGRGAGPAVSL